MSEHYLATRAALRPTQSSSSHSQSTSTEEFQYHSASSSAPQDIYRHVEHTTPRRSRLLSPDSTPTRGFDKVSPRVRNNPFFLAEVNSVPSRISRNSHTIDTSAKVKEGCRDEKTTAGHHRLNIPASAPPLTNSEGNLNSASSDISNALSGSGSGSGSGTETGNGSSATHEIISTPQTGVFQEHDWNGSLLPSLHISSGNQKQIVSSDLGLHSFNFATQSNSNPTYTSNPEVEPTSYPSKTTASSPPQCYFTSRSVGRTAPLNNRHSTMTVASHVSDWTIPPTPLFSPDNGHDRERDRASSPFPEAPDSNHFSLPMVTDQEDGPGPGLGSRTRNSTYTHSEAGTALTTPDLDNGKENKAAGEGFEETRFTDRAWSGEDVESTLIGEGILNDQALSHPTLRLVTSDAFLDNPHEDYASEPNEEETHGLGISEFTGFRSGSPSSSPQSTTEGQRHVSHALSTVAEEIDFSRMGSMMFPSRDGSSSLTAGRTTLRRDLTSFDLASDISPMALGPYPASDSDPTNEPGRTPRRKPLPSYAKDDVFSSPAHESEPEIDVVLDGCTRPLTLRYSTANKGSAEDYGTPTHDGFKISNAVVATTTSDPLRPDMVMSMSSSATMEKPLPPILDSTSPLALHHSTIPTNRLNSHGLQYQSALLDRTYENSALIIPDESTLNYPFERNKLIKSPLKNNKITVSPLKKMAGRVSDIGKKVAHSATAGKNSFGKKANDIRKPGTSGWSKAPSMMSNTEGYPSTTRPASYIHYDESEHEVQPSDSRSVYSGIQPFPSPYPPFQSLPPPSPVVQPIRCASPLSGHIRLQDFFLGLVLAPCTSGSWTWAMREVTLYQECIAIRDCDPYVQKTFSIPMKNIESIEILGFEECSRMALPPFRADELAAFGEHEQRLVVMELIRGEGGSQYLALPYGKRLRWKYELEQVITQSKISPPEENRSVQNHQEMISQSTVLPSSPAKVGALAVYSPADEPSSRFQGPTAPSDPHHVTQEDVSRFAGPMSPSDPQRDEVRAGNSVERQLSVFRKKTDNSHDRRSPPTSPAVLPSGLPTSSEISPISGEVRRARLEYFETDDDRKGHSEDDEVLKIKNDHVNSPNLELDYPKHLKSTVVPIPKVPRTRSLPIPGQKRVSSDKVCDSNLPTDNASPLLNSHTVTPKIGGLGLIGTAEALKSSPTALPKEVLQDAADAVILQSPSKDAIAMPGTYPETQPLTQDILRRVMSIANWQEKQGDLSELHQTLTANLGLLHHQVSAQEEPTRDLVVKHHATHQDIISKLEPIATLPAQFEQLALLNEIPVRVENGFRVMQSSMNEQLAELEARHNMELEGLKVQNQVLIGQLRSEMNAGFLSVTNATNGASQDSSQMFGAIRAETVEVVQSEYREIMSKQAAEDKKTAEGLRATIYKMKNQHRDLEASIGELMQRKAQYERQTDEARQTYDSARLVRSTANKQAQQVLEARKQRSLPSPPMKLQRPMQPTPGSPSSSSGKKLIRTSPAVPKIHPPKPLAKPGGFQY